MGDNMLGKFNWYVVHVYSGFEKKIAQQITEQAQAKGLSGYVEAVLVPTESTIDMKKGQRIVTESKFYPGYVLVRMVLTDDTWHLVKNTPKVTGFLGPKMHPSPISEDEAERIIRQATDRSVLRKLAPMFHIGETVRVSDGPFSSFTGLVEDVDSEKCRLKVSVSIFGRSTPVELEYNQVEKCG